MTLDYAKLCGICAWRGTCQKKFSLSQDALHCPDYSKDVTIKERPEKEAEVKEKK
ncbi:MAG: hypothetical protein AABY54_05480 [Deltaproteobacteria bacterium]